MTYGDLSPSKREELADDPEFMRRLEEKFKGQMVDLRGALNEHLRRQVATVESIVKEKK